VAVISDSLTDEPAQAALYALLRRGFQAIGQVAHLPTGPTLAGHLGGVLHNVPTELMTPHGVDAAALWHTARQTRDWMVSPWATRITPTYRVSRSLLPYWDAVFPSPPPRPPSLFGSHRGCPAIPLLSSLLGGQRWMPIRSQVVVCPLEPRWPYYQETALLEVQYRALTSIRNFGLEWGFRTPELLSRTAAAVDTL